LGLLRCLDGLSPVVVRHLLERTQVPRHPALLPLEVDVVEGREEVHRSADHADAVRGHAVVAADTSLAIAAAGAFPATAVGGSLEAVDDPVVAGILRGRASTVVAEVAGAVGVRLAHLADRARLAGRGAAVDVDLPGVLLLVGAHRTGARRHRWAVAAVAAIVPAALHERARVVGVFGALEHGTAGDAAVWRPWNVAACRGREHQQGQGNDQRLHALSFVRGPY